MLSAMCPLLVLFKKYIPSSVYLDQNALLGVDWSGSTPFVYMPKLVLDVRFYLQQKTSADQTAFSDALFS